MRAAVHGRPDEARSADAPYGARSCEPMRRRVFLFRPSAEPVVDVKNGTWLNGVSLIRGVAVSFDASRVVLCWLTWPRGVNSWCKVAITGGKLGLAFDGLQSLRFLRVPNQEGKRGRFASFDEISVKRKVVRL
ncbi:hypothetical protein OPV22_011522 [Ensete ventricosum]|uniref:F-box associated domain-containing protein n=1 Tax=Ensete ventricosum TaxID=4639 RepID=A0AAV8RFW3_ENSVE|nr:hypothetical protein OPV22_011522 [Ensete ventricosum]